MHRHLLVSKQQQFLLVEKGGRGAQSCPSRKGPALWTSFLKYTASSLQSRLQIGPSVNFHRAYLSRPPTPSPFPSQLQQRVNESLLQNRWQFFKRLLQIFAAGVGVVGRDFKIQENVPTLPDVHCSPLQTAHIPHSSRWSFSRTPNCTSPRTFRGALLFHRPSLLVAHLWNEQCQTPNKGLYRKKIL